MSRTDKDRPYWVKIKDAEKANRLRPSSHYDDVNHLRNQRRELSQNFWKSDSKVINDYVDELESAGFTVNLKEYVVAWDGVAEAPAAYHEPLAWWDKPSGRTRKAIKVVGIKTELVDTDAQWYKHSSPGMKKTWDVNGSLPVEMMDKSNFCDCAYCANGKYAKVQHEEKFLESLAKSDLENYYSYFDGD